MHGSEITAHDFIVLLEPGRRARGEGQETGQKKESEAIPEHQKAILMSAAGPSGVEMSESFLNPTC